MNKLYLFSLFGIFFIKCDVFNFIYWQCNNSEKGCKEEDTILANCMEEEYVFKLNPQICQKLGGQVTHYFCDNYISPSENFTLEKCSVSERRGCSFLKCFNNKGIIRTPFECTVDGTTNHMKHIYFPHYLIDNYERLKTYIDFGIPNELSSNDNGEVVCAFETQQDLMEYLIWTVEGKFVYSWGGGHEKNFYGPTKGTTYKNKCPNDINVVGFDCSGLVLYMLKMLGNNIKMNGGNCNYIYELGQKLGLEKTKDNIKLGDVLLFGDNSTKVHTVIAIDNVYALEAPSHNKDCTGKPIQRSKISDLLINHSNNVWVIDFLQKKTYLDGDKYLKEESVERKVVVVKAIYNFFEESNCFYISVTGIGQTDANYNSYVMFINFSNKRKLRNLNENNTKLKFFCDYNSSNTNENMTEISLINYNCSTDEYDDIDNINITEEDNLVESLELIDKEEEKYLDLSNINKTMNLSDIIYNISGFDLDNLTNYITFTINDTMEIDLNNESIFTIEGKSNYELSDDINIKLSINNTNNSNINCNFSSNEINSSILICKYDFNISNIETEENISIYSIKENEIVSNNKNIFFIGLNKVQFIYKKKMILENEDINNDNNHGINDNIDNSENQNNNTNINNDDNDKNSKKRIKIIIIVVSISSVILILSITIMIIFIIKKKKRINSVKKEIIIINQKKELSKDEKSVMDKIKGSSNSISNI